MPAEYLSDKEMWRDSVIHDVSRDEAIMEAPNRFAFPSRSQGYGKRDGRDWAAWRREMMEKYADEDGLLPESPKPARRTLGRRPKEKPVVAAATPLPEPRVVESKSETESERTARLAREIEELTAKMRAERGL